ncbi:MRN complex-interacting protein isoform X2 [Pogona vitticeps]
MAQQFQVLRCCSCHVFQVQQVRQTCPSVEVKKSKKWNCKICNEKQSVLKVFGQGSGSDCRHHVQKLNLLQRDREQTPMNIPRCIEEPVQIGNENTVVNLEEKLDWQDKRFESVSRWTKYLDERCEEQEKEVGEEEMVLTEKQQICSSREKTAKHPRKRKKTSLCIIDGQGQMEQSVSGFADNVKSFENSPDSITLYTKNCGDVPCKSVLSPAVEEQVLHRKNKDAGSKGPGLSKWEKFLLSSKGGASSGMLQETQTQSSGAGARGKKAVISVDTSPRNWPHPLEQKTPILVEQVQNHVTVAGAPMERSKPSPVLGSTHLQEKLLNRLPKETSSIPAKNPLAASNSNTLYINLFSTGDDFDDDI